MRSLIRLFLIFAPFLLHAQADSTSGLHVNKKGLRRAVIGSTAVYGISLVGLHHLWYRNSESQSFRFFNDNAEWKQVDKIGHAFSSFYLSYGVSRGLTHYHVPERKSDLIGAITAFGVMLPIEIFDGHSAAYGASSGDLLANATGALLYLGQKRMWNEVRIAPKFSFHFTDYADLRPDLLGKGGEQILKDYNGQTYWLSFDMDKFCRFPKWLNLAVGYGADGMIYARDEQHPQDAQPYRQYYIGLDFDPGAIRTRSKAVKTLLFIAGMIRLPAPALEFSSRGTKFHAFYY